MPVAFLTLPTCKQVDQLTCRKAFMMLTRQTAGHVGYDECRFREYAAVTYADYDVF
jgi:hypothetical protein